MVDSSLKKGDVIKVGSVRDSIDYRKCLSCRGEKFIFKSVDSKDLEGINRLNLCCVTCKHSCYKITPYCKVLIISRNNYLVKHGQDWFGLWEY